MSPGQAVASLNILFFSKVRTSVARREQGGEWFSFCPAHQYDEHLKCPKTTFQPCFVQKSVAISFVLF